MGQGLPSIALWVAALLGAAVAGLLGVFLVRRLLAAVLARRLQRRVQRVEAIVDQHRRARFETMDRLLFQLAEVQDLPAVETVLGKVLEGAPEAERPALQKLYGSLGLVDRYLRELRTAERWSVRAAAAAALGQLRVGRAIPELVATMRDPHEDASTVRLAAARALSHMEATEAAPLLVAELAAPDEWASPRIAEVLVGFGQSAVPSLTAALSSESTNARVWAVQILGQLGSAAVEVQLISLLRDRSEQVRLSATEALGRMKVRSAVNDLVRVAMRDPVPPVRAEAARSLGAIGDPSAVTSLVMLLSDPDYWSRLRAIEAIELIAPDDPSPLEQALRDRSPEIRGRAAVAMERVGMLRRCAEELKSEDGAARGRARRTLIELGQAGLVESILALLEQPDFRIRSRVADVLGAVGDVHALPSLGPLVRDPMWPVRARAVEAIAQIGGPQALRLIAPALSDGEETVRATAVRAVQTLGLAAEDTAVEDVLRLYDNPNAEIRTGVLEAVGALVHPTVETVLERALRDPIPEVRMRAVQAVSARASERWLGGLTAALADPDVAVRIAAVSGLGRVGNDAAMAAVVESLGTKDRELREALTTLLASQGLEKVRLLVGAPASREAALALIWTLGKTRDAGAVPALRLLLEGGSAEMRAAVAGALAKIEDPESEALLTGMLNDRSERVRAAAVNAAATLKTSTAVPKLILGLKDPDSFVRNRVVLALGRIGGPQGLAGLDMARLRYAADPVISAYVTVARGLCGGDGIQMALEALADRGHGAEVEKVLAREGQELARSFRQNLHLEAAPGEGGLAPAALATQYAQVLRSHRDPEQRSAAIQALQSLGLGALGEQQKPFGAELEVAVHDVRNALLDAVATDPSAVVRRLALEALGEAVAELGSTFVRALRDPAVEVQIEAVQALGKTRQPQHNRSLLVCFGVGDAGLDQALVEALAAINRDGAVAFVDEIMGQREPAVLRGGAAVLQRLGDPRTTGLLQVWRRSSDAELRRATVRALGAVGTLDAKQALIESLGDTDEAVRLSVVQELCRLPGSDTLRALQSATRDPSIEIRRALAAGVGGMRNVAAIDLAETLARDPDADVRTDALLALPLLRDADALERFLQLLPSQPDEVKLRIRRIPDSHPAQVELEKLVRGDVRPAVRTASLRVLGALGRKPVEVLLQALRDPEPEVRVAAIEAVGGALEGRPLFREALESLLRDPDKRVQDAVRKLRMAVS